MQARFAAHLPIRLPGPSRKATSASSHASPFCCTAANTTPTPRLQGGSGILMYSPRSHVPLPKRCRGSDCNAVAAYSCAHPVLAHRCHNDVAVPTAKRWRHTRALTPFSCTAARTMSRFRQQGGSGMREHSRSVAPLPTRCHDPNCKANRVCASTPVLLRRCHDDQLPPPSLPPPRSQSVPNVGSVGRTDGGRDWDARRGGRADGGREGKGPNATHPENQHIQ